MRYLLPAVFGALSLIYVGGVVAQDVPACVPACASQVRGEFSQFSCASADDAACLCANANFGFGVRDCGQSGCGSTDVQIQAYLAGSFCQGQPLAFTPTGTQAPPTSAIPSTAGSPAATTTPATTTTPLPTTAPATASAIPETTIPQTSSLAVLPPATTAPATTAPAATQTSSPLTSNAPPPTTTNAVSPETSPTSTSATSAASSTTAASATSATDSSAPASSETSAAVAQTGGSGLSQGAAIGIGVGVAGGVVAIAFAAVFLFLRNRGRAPHASFDISQPPSSSGHGQGAFEKYSNDIEMVSKRYEDMVPRQQPRVMV
ncbi:hypothetical protein V8C37DRAFT_316511 [Trichoderma ceciliae]